MPTKISQSWKIPTAILCSSALADMLHWHHMACAKHAYYKEELKNSPQATVTEVLKVRVKLHSSGKRSFSDLWVSCFSFLFHLTSRSYFTTFVVRDFLTTDLLNTFLMGKLISPPSPVLLLRKSWTAPAQISLHDFSQLPWWLKMWLKEVAYDKKSWTNLILITLKIQPKMTYKLI